MRDLTPEWDEVVLQVSSSVARLFPGQDRDDVAQETRLFFCTSPKVGTYLEAGEEGERMLRSSLRNHAMLVCRKERAAARGYEVDDEFSYSVAALRNLLPRVFHYEDWLPTVSGFTDMPRAQSKPAEGNNLLAALVDVKSAFLRLSEDQRAVLLDSFYDGLSDNELALRDGIDPDSVRKRTHRALARMRDLLSYHRPEHDGPGSRRVVSNAAARAQVRDV